MKIILVYPLLSRKRSLIDENKQFWPPLGLAYIASVLEENGHSVEILDRDVVLRKNGLDFDKVDAITSERIKDSRPGIVGISLTTPNMPDASHISQLVKSSFKDAMVVLGGPHVTGEPELTLKEMPSADIAVRGEGEYAMLELAEGRAVEETRGITYRKDNDIISNIDREPIPDIDALPFPARHLLDMEFYTRPSRYTSRNLSLRTTSIFTARGCPYRCNFCAGPLVFSGKVRHHSPARVISEIEELISRYSIEAIYFAEDMFLSSKDRAEEILNLFVERGINKKTRWFAQAKANIITPELLQLMKEAGCVGVEYGYESGSQRILDMMNKRLRVEENIRAADLTRKAGLRFQANIIVGYPGEREEDFRKTIDFIKRIHPNMIGFNIFMPLPGTSSYETLKHEGKTLPRWEDIGDPEAPQVNYADMPKGTFEKLYIKARLKVILPMNLTSFVKDNINNPLRLLRIGFTQFNGVVIKTLRSISRLASFKKSNTSDVANVLFLSYNGLLEPILPSQAIPYLIELAKKNFKFVLLTYEKQGDLKRVGKKVIKDREDDLMSSGIEWRRLRYHKNPPILSTLFDIFIGTLYSFYIILTRHIKVVHVRGITSGMMIIFLSKIFKLQILFDMRGLLAEEYVGGGLWKEDSLSFKLVKKAERHMLETASAITVLTKKHFELNKSLGYLKNAVTPMDVVPCCVDMNRFYYDPKKESDFRRTHGLDDKLILMYPGKIGTFYFIDEMLFFFKEMTSVMGNAIFVILTGDDITPVLEKARAIDIKEDNLMAIKNVPFEEIPNYLRIADAGIFFINPYKKIGSSPIKMGEFLASGVPVIINPGVGDTEELVLENRVGIVVRDFNQRDYKMAIGHILKLKEEGEALRIRCRETAGKYLSLDDAVTKYARLYEILSEVKR